MGVVVGLGAVVDVVVVDETEVVVVDAACPVDTLGPELPHAASTTDATTVTPSSVKRRRVRGRFIARVPPLGEGGDVEW